MDLTPRTWYGKDIIETLTTMAANYQRTADKLRELAKDVPNIGTQQGLNIATATDVAAEVLAHISRNTASPINLIRAASAYDLQVGTNEISESCPYTGPTTGVSCIVPAGPLVMG